MKTADVINLDFRKEENKNIIQKVLRQIKPLSKFSEDEDIPLEAIEKVIKVVTNKYAITPQWMSMSFHEPTCTYSIGIKRSDNHHWIDTVFGMCVYEIFAKLAIRMYAEIKTGKIPLKTLSKEEEEREKIARSIDSRRN